MAITINWATKIISIPQADLTSLGGSLYQLDIDAFRLALKDLEDSEDGMPFPITHNHNTQVTLAGVTYARTVEIINGYTITFEDGQYAVNLVGANSNLGDVTNINQVSIRSNNSAGLVVGEGSSYTPQQIATAVANEEIESGYTLAEMLRLMGSVAAGNATGMKTNATFKSIDGTKERITATILGEDRTITSRDPS